ATCFSYKKLQRDKIRSPITRSIDPAYRLRYITPQMRNENQDCPACNQRRQRMRRFAKPFIGVLFRIAIVGLILVPGVNAIAQNRMPPIPNDKMTTEQKKALEDFLGARGTLTGPWVALLRSPDLMTRTRGLSDYLRFKSALPPRLSEFVILMTARQYTQQY